MHIGFESSRPLAVTQAHDIGPNEWRLTEALIYHDGTRSLTVPAEQSTDFASVPAVLNWLVPTSTGLAAAIVHDYAWRVLVPAGHLTYRTADELLRQALGTLGVDPVTSWMMWAAVRWGALTRPGGRRGWWRDAPRVLAISIPAAILVLPALLLLPSMLIKKLLRWLFPGRGHQIHEGGGR